MKWRDAVELVALAAIWGASFLFMRILAPLVGPLATADLRMLIGGLFLLVIFIVTSFNPDIRKNFWAFLVIGIVNSAVPFALYSYAALVLPASVEVILNALSPAFGALAGAIFLSERLTPRKFGGLFLGFAGVLLVAGGLPSIDKPSVVFALGICLLAPISYALGGVLVKKMAKSIAPKALAFGSQFVAGFLFLPSVAFGNPQSLLVANNVLLLLSFGILCSGIAYLFYYGLMSRIGPTKTLTVTFLMPVFGILWGMLFLNEPLTLTLVGGMLVVLLGTWLVTSK